jgi:hypothetical protein
MAILRVGKKEFSFGKKKEIKNIADVITILRKYEMNDYVKNIMAKILHETFNPNADDILKEVIEDDNIPDHFKYHPSLVEYVVVPQNFDVERHMSVRELAGFYQDNRIDVDRIIKYNQGVCNSGIAVFPIGSAEAFCSLYWYFSILQDLKLIIEEANNPLRPGGGQYKDEFKSSYFGRYIENQTKRNWGIAIIFNMYMLWEDKLVNSAKNRLMEYHTTFPSL